MSNTIVEKNLAAPPLNARLANWMKSAIDNVELLKELTDLHGSPLHITELSEFKNNISELKKPFQDRNLKGDLFFARKANKLPWFVKSAGESGIGVDTASLNEVRETIEMGVEPHKVVVTAIGKDKALVSHCLKWGCLLIIDNYDELELIDALAKTTNKKARVGLRFSGFQTDYRTVFSRFGFPIEDAFKIANKVLDSSFLELEIFHAHIDKYKTEERATAAFAMLSIIDELKKSRSTNIKGIDLGGGILISYLKRKEEWNEYLEELKNSVLEKRPSFNADNDGLGLKNVDGNLEGEAHLYPFWNNKPKAKFIEDILDKEDSGEPLYKALSRRNLELFFEPGRALLDNTGITLARVAFRKNDTENNLIIGLSMNRMNLRPFRAEFCIDPIHLSQREETPTEDAAYLAGCLCSESDLIYRRKIQLKNMPRVDDLYLFPNTAGYLAHHMEIGTHGNPIPGNILIDTENFKVLDTA